MRLVSHNKLRLASLDEAFSQQQSWHLLHVFHRRTTTFFRSAMSSLMKKAGLIFDEHKVRATSSCSLLMGPQCLCYWLFPGSAGAWFLALPVSLFQNDCKQVPGMKLSIFLCCCLGVLELVRERSTFFATLSAPIEHRWHSSSAPQHTSSIVRGYHLVVYLVFIYRIMCIYL